MARAATVLGSGSLPPEIRRRGSIGGGAGGRRGLAICEGVRLSRVASASTRGRGTSPQGDPNSQNGFP
jgi:hypothetical protein